MGKQIGIFYFSATGNTEYVVRQVALRIQEQGAAVCIKKIETILKNRITVDWEKYSYIGIAYPVYGFGAPSIVHDFIRTIVKLKQQPVFIFAVSCDPIALNEAATIQVRNMVMRRGGVVLLERHVPMPANWGISYPIGLSRQLIKRAEKKAQLWAGEIITQKKDRLKPGLLSRLLAWVCKMEAIGAAFYGKDFKVSGSCNLCQKCIKDCPRNNITIKNEKIHWGWKCIICMRCHYYCPRQAVNLRIYKITIPPEPYSAEEILNRAGSEECCVTRETKGWYSHFYSYLYED